MQKKIDGELQYILNNIIGGSINSWITLDKNQKLAMEQNGETLPKVLARTILAEDLFERKEKKSILFVMDQGIGNLIMLLPTAQAIQELFNDCEIFFHLKSGIKSILSKDFELQTLEDDDIKNFKNRKGEKYFDFIVFSVWSDLFIQKYASNPNYYDMISKRHYKLNIHDPRIHEAYHNFKIVQDFGYEKELPIPIINLNVVRDFKKEIDILASNNKLIAISDTTLNLPDWQKKRYPHYYQLMKLLVEEGYHPVLIGGKDEANQPVPNGATNMAGQTKLNETAYIISKCDVFIGNDSGPAHIAGAVGIPTFVIFGPTLTTKNRPIGENVFTLKSSLDCIPCQYTDNFTSCKENKCLSQINPVDLWQTVNKKLESTKQEKNILMVGNFGSGALRTEFYIEKYLKRKDCLVDRFDCFDISNKIGATEMNMQLLSKVVSGNYDCVIINGGRIIQPKILSMTKGVVNPIWVNIYLDQRRGIEDWHLKLVQFCDVSFWSTGDEVLLDFIRQKTGKEIFYWTSTVDTEEYKPNPEVTDEDWQKYSCDVIFVGSYFKEKEPLIKRILEERINIKIFGSGWPEEYLVPGPLFGQDLIKALSCARIVLNTNIINDVRKYFSDRNFYAFACGRMNLANYVPGLEEFFENKKDLVWFENESDCIDKIKYYLANLGEREKIATNGIKIAEKLSFKNVVDNLYDRIFSKTPREEKNIFLSKKLDRISIIPKRYSQWIHPIIYSNIVALSKYFEIDTYRVNSKINITCGDIKPVGNNYFIWELDNIDGLFKIFRLSNIKEGSESLEFIPGINLEQCDMSSVPIPKQNQILYIGNIDDEKQIMTLIDSLGIVAKTHPKNMPKFFMTGFRADTNLVQKTIRKMQSYGIPHELIPHNLIDSRLRNQLAKSSLFTIMDKNLKLESLITVELLYNGCIVLMDGGIFDLPVTTYRELFMGIPNTVFVNFTDKNHLSKNINELIDLEPDIMNQFTVRDLIKEKFDVNKKAIEFRDVIYPKLLELIKEKNA